VQIAQASRIRCPPDDDEVKRSAVESGSAHLCRLRCLFAAVFCCVAIARTHAQEAEAPPPALSILLQTLAKSDDAGAQLNLLRGMNAALKGRRNVAAPPEWEALAAKLSQSPNAEVREQAQTLGAVFGSGAAFDAMRKTVNDPAADSAARQKALESLIAGRDKASFPLLQKLIGEAGPLRRIAIRGLAAFDDDTTPRRLIEAYRSFDSDEKRDALGTLLARAAWARLLVEAIENQQIAATDLAAPQVRQLIGLKDPAVDAWLKKNPALAATSPNKQAEIARYKQQLTPELLRSGDANAGRALFAQTCAACHTLFGTGGAVGPELTGANRTDIDYLLQNIIDPNALIGKDYQSATVETKDGRILVGMLRGDDANTVSLRTLAETIIVPRSDVRTIQVSEVSMMPEGLLNALDQTQLRDLFTYLASPRQVPILTTPLNAADFFNGTDLTRWRASSDAWKVDRGAIVGTAARDKTESIESEMVAADFRLKAQLKISGEKSAAELVFVGQAAPSSPFAGCSLSFGGVSRVNVWRYQTGSAPQSVAANIALTPGEWHTCDITVRGGKAVIDLDGARAFDMDVPSNVRSAISFFLTGEQAELSVKDLALTPLAP
jgi:putative heme-binding domain-containing protein